MKFFVVRLLTNTPDPTTGVRASASTVLGDALREAPVFEDLGFDAYAIGEHHINDAEASSPPVILGHIAATTKRLRLFTGVTVLPLLDPVRVAEDYATLDVISGGRVEIIIGKGNTEEQSRVFGYTNDDQWDRNAEKYELLRRLLREEDVTWAGTYRPPLDHFTSRPRPLQDPIRIWHGSATSTRSTDLAARWGDPLFSANVSGPLEQYRRSSTTTASGGWPTGGTRPTRSSVPARPACTSTRTPSGPWPSSGPSYEAFQSYARANGLPQQFASLEDAVARGSYFVGSPQQVLEQFHRYHDAFGHEVQHVGNIGSLDDPVRRRSIDLFAERVLPVLHDTFPDRLWDGPAAPPSAGPRPPRS